ncbi:MAG: sugar transferase [Parvibaculaceae bacterium]
MWKRIVDIFAAASGLIVLALPLAAVALAVRLFLGSPVLFRQQRLGRNGKLFRIAKFRTMKDARDAKGALLPDAERLTPFGRFLRATSLDELPELWNVLRGDMSLVGPRPLLPEYEPYYLDDQFRRHEVAPGLTGLAQVTGRNALSWDERFALDVEYVDNLSFWGDVRILLLTVWRVMARDGISAEGHETMPRFDEQVKAGKARGRMPEEGSGVTAERENT